MPLDAHPTSPKLPKRAIAAAVIALLLAIAALVSSLHQPVLIFSALAPAMAAAGILRKRVWGAYGFAFFLLGQAVLTPIVLLRAPTASKVQLAVVLGLDLILALLFFLAGRSLAAIHAKRGWLAPWIVVTCLLTLPLVFLQAFVIPTGGMENTLLRGDRILVRVFPRGTPAREDIVVFRYPVDPRQTFVKRVIGLPGDHIKIVSQVVYRNGAPLREPYVIHSLPMPDPYGSDFPGTPLKLPEQLGSAMASHAEDMLDNHVSNGEVVVPPGKYFVLGDNRDNSLDSRYWGFVDASDLVGKPILIYNSEIENGGYSATTASRSKHQIRWNRLFKPL